MVTITRSAGTPIPGSALVAGGGYQGATRDLDLVVAYAAAALAGEYGQDVEIRFNSDRESGGAFLVTPDGRNGHVGIGASLVTARKRAAWEQHAVECETMARTGICTWGGTATASQRRGARKCAAEWRGFLARNPEGQLTVYAHLNRVAVLPQLRCQLEWLPGWNPMEHAGHLAYHHGSARTVHVALARCLRFAPAADYAAQLADWENDGGASS